jgi:hypothetical protein
MTASPLTCTFSNGEDETRAHVNLTDQALIRRVTTVDLIVDRRNQFCLVPARMVDELGLESARGVTVWTPSGVRRGNVYDHVSVSVADRSATLACLSVEGVDRVTLGRMALLALGLELAPRGEVGLLPEPYIRV